MGRRSKRTFDLGEGTQRNQVAEGEAHLVYAKKSRPVDLDMAQDNDTGRTRKRGYPLMAEAKTQSMDLPEDEPPVVYAKKSRPVAVDMAQDNDTGRTRKRTLDVMAEVRTQSLELPEDEPPVVYAKKSRPVAVELTRDDIMIQKNIFNERKSSPVDQELVEDDEMHQEDVRNNKNRLKCPHCDKSLCHKRALAGHIKSYHEIKKCTFCDQMFPDRKSMYNHKKTHWKVPQSAQCDICRKVFTTYAYMKKHQDAIHIRPGKCCECPTCHKLFSARYIKVHERSHEKKHLCDMCGKSYANLIILRRHQENHKAHTFKCWYCGARYPDKTDLQTHKQTHQRQCYECKDVFLNSKLFRAHIPTHLKDKLYQCLTCGQVFEKHISLSQHERDHEQKGELHICDKCGYHFENNATLNYHVQMHNAKNNAHKCSICSRTFSSARYLKAHTQRHSQPNSRFGISPNHKCILCDHAFKTKRGLLQHSCYFKIHKHLGSMKGIQAILNEKYKSGLKSVDTTMAESELQPSQDDVDQETVAIVNEIERMLTKPLKDKTMKRRKKTKNNRPVSDAALPCTRCGRRFRNAITLQQHGSNYHGETRHGAFGCRFCPLRFDTYLLRHLHLHYVHGFRSRNPYRLYGVAITKRGRRPYIYVGFTCGNIRAAARERLREWCCTFREMVRRGWTFRWRKAFPFGIQTRRLSDAHNKRSFVRRTVRAVASIAKVEALDTLRVQAVQLVTRVRNVMALQRRRYGAWRKYVRYPVMRKMIK